MIKRLAPSEPCLCYSGRKYKVCCRPFHLGRNVTTPEALMRSRYCAYALGDISYIMTTTHTESPHFRVDDRRWREDIAHFCLSTEFEGLEVIGSGQEGETGWVRFHALLLNGTDDASFEEMSQFVMQDGKWRYLSGEVAIVR